jgi:hypothetical protein
MDGHVELAGQVELLGQEELTCHEEPEDYVELAGSGRDGSSVVVGGHV